MSVSLSYTSEKEPDGKGSIPIATHDAFKNRWLPGCEALGLKWVPQFFDPGLDVRADNADEVLQELGRLRKWMIEHNSKDDAEWLLGRLDRLVGTLKELKALPNMGEASIG